MPALKSKYPRGVGDVKLVDGNICFRDDKGRLYVQAPRRADVDLARRLGAQLQEMRDLGEIEALPEVTAVTVKAGK